MSNVLNSSSSSSVLSGRGAAEEGEPTLNNDHLDFGSMIEMEEPRSSIDIEMGDLSKKSLLDNSPHNDHDRRPRSDFSVSPSGTPTVTFEPPSNDEDFGVVRRRTGKPAPAIANLTNCILAAGAVSGSYALSQSGLFLGLIAYVAIGSLMDYSLNLLVREANITGVYDYKELCKRGYGWYGYAAITFAQWGQSYGSMVSYLIIATDTFLALSQLVTGNGEPLVSRSLLAIILVAVIVLPLSFLKSVSALGKASYISMFSVAVIAVTMLIRAITGIDYESSEVPPVHEYKFSSVNAIRGLGIAAFSFTTHHEALIMYDSLAVRTEHAWARISHISCYIALMTLVFIACCGYFTFYGQSCDNILVCYPFNDPVISVSRAFFGVTMLLTFPLEHLVARDTVLGVLELKWPALSKGRAAFVTVTVAHVLSCLGITLLTSNVGTVLTLVGGLCASTLAYIMPGLLCIKFDGLRKKIMLSYVLVALGVLLAVACSTWVILRDIIGIKV